MPAQPISPWRSLGLSGLVACLTCWSILLAATYGLHGVPLFVMAVSLGCAMGLLTFLKAVLAAPLPPPPTDYRHWPVSDEPEPDPWRRVVVPARDNGSAS